MASDAEAPTACENDNNDAKCALASMAPGPRRNLGRSARRRRKKLAEIQRAEEQLLRGSTCDQLQYSVSTNNDVPASSLIPSNEIIPSDRDKIWPGVQERRLNSLQEDAPKLMAQLGYIPGNAIRIAARISDIPVLKRNARQGNNDDDMPVVLQLYPIVVRDVHLGGKAGSRKFKSRKRTRTSSNDEEGQPNNKNSNPGGKGNNNENGDDDFVVEPFPTLYWLTHPLLRTLVSKLELNSMGVELEKRLKNDKDAMACMERAHEAYGQERYDLLTPGDISFVQQRKWEAAFSPERGVAGIRNYASIKCLHSHTAHYLSSGGKGSSDNIVGKWVMEKVAAMISSKSEDDVASDKSQGMV